MTLKAKASWLLATAFAVCALNIDEARSRGEVSTVSPAPVVQLDAWGRDAVRIRIAPPGGTIVDPPLMALLPNAPNATSPPSSSGTSLTSGNLEVSFDPTNGFLTVTRVSDGYVLLQTANMTWGPADPYSRSGSVSATITFAGHGSERIYGLGEHRTGKVDQSGFSQLFSDGLDYHISHGSDSFIPYYGSSIGYGFVWNLPSYGYVNLTSSELTWHSNATLNLDFWVCTTTAGLDTQTTSIYANMLSKATDVMGHAPPMPFYATGFIQCKNRYRNQTQLLDVARGYVSRGLPISTIVIDYFHWPNSVGDWRFNPACWPDPQAMVDELTSMGIELMVTFWPFQQPNSDHWDMYSSQGYLATNYSGVLLPFDNPGMYLYDATNAQARNQTFWSWYQGYGQYGIKTIWLDAAEPERSGQINFGGWKLALGSDTEIMMAYPQQHVRAFAENMASIGVGPSDYFVLARHVWAGSSRYSAGLWSGDINSTFEELSLQVRSAQSTVMSGQVLYTTDIGGYANGNASDPVFQDLIVRWFQFGAFCPLFRLHGKRLGGPPANECGLTNGDNEIWNLAADDEHYEALAAMMYLRENLREYVVTTNAEAAATGMPMMRPMFLAFPGDQICVDNANDFLDGQFMFGRDWLVSPVTTYGATSWIVYLPVLDPSEQWVYWFNQTAYAGGQNVTVDTSSIANFPLFLRQPVNATGDVHMPSTSNVSLL